ncbi:MAG: lipoprotein B transmembrane [Thiobacillus sp. SCN 63-374]|nr:MAG: lipoprotein B transmembrane [Thiobacillus sp. SCN 63-374]
MKRRLFLAALPAALVAGCGFQLRRVADLPFASLYIEAASGSAVAQRIRSLLTANKQTRLVATADEAEAVLKITQEERTRVILSLSGAGRVTEYRLGLRLSYSVNDKAGLDLAAPEAIELTRDITYDDTKVLAKGTEEQLLYRDMDDNAALRILRRLQNLKPGIGAS